LTVNQRVLGSSPRGGAKSEIQSIYLGWIFCFWSTPTALRTVLSYTSAFSHKIQFSIDYLKLGVLFGTSI
ncbi:MAG: hypothetical protein NWP64_10910, partial [Maribacter sp.]|nr:hypothetical protein [Maribacter sp.]